MNLLGVKAAADFMTIVNVTNSSDSHMTWGYSEILGDEPYDSYYDFIDSNGILYYDVDRNGTLSEKETEQSG